MVRIQAAVVLALSLACSRAEEVEFRQSEQLVAQETAAVTPDTAAVPDSAAITPETAAITPDTAATQGTQDSLPPELTPAMAAKIPPFPPTKVVVKSEGSRSTVTWQLSPVDTVVKYRIYRKMPGQQKLTKIGETDTARFVDLAAVRGAQYAVTAVNSYGAETPLASTPLSRDVSTGRATDRPGRPNLD
jgi:hypothetical protein